MTGADQAGTFGPSRTRTSLVVYRIAVGAERKKAISYVDCTMSMLMQIMCVCCSADKNIPSSSFKWCFQETSLLGFNSLAVFLLAYTTRTKEGFCGLAGMLSPIPPPMQARTGAISPSCQRPGIRAELRAASWPKSSCSSARHYPSKLRSAS